MTRTVVLIVTIFLSILIMAACGSSATSFSRAIILPEECRLTVKQELSLALEGFVPPQAVVRWHVDQGEISFVLTRAEAIFIAPSEPGVVTISASMTPTLPGMKAPITRQCTVTSLNTAPSGLAKADDLFVGWLKLPHHSNTMKAH